MAEIYYYDPQSAGITMQSPQSESTPRRLTLMQTGQVVVRYSSFNGRAMHDFRFSKNFAL